MSGFSIVIPVYNEGGNISAALERIHADVEGNFSVYIVYDSEADTSLPFVRSFCAKEPSADVKLVKNAYGRGVLGALKTGLKICKTEFIVVTMADLSDPPRVINQMVAAGEAGADIVCASRYMKGGSHIGGPRFKKLLSFLAGRILNLVSGVPTKDITNNFRLYRRRILESIQIESDGGFELAMELTVKAHSLGYSIREVPTQWTDRVAGSSNFKMMKWLPKYLRWFFFCLFSLNRAPVAKI